MRIGPTVIVIGLGLSAYVTPVPAQDFLGSFLESQRYNNLLEHQQRQIKPRNRAGQPAQQRGAASMSSSRRAQLARQLKPEYERRVRRDGKASADLWLKRTAWQLGYEEGRKARRRAR